MSDKKIKRVFKFAIVDKHYAAQGKEFKEGMGAGVFTHQEVTCNLTEKEYASPMFAATLARRQQAFLAETFDVTIEEIQTTPTVEIHSAVPGGGKSVALAQEAEAEAIAIQCASLMASRDKPFPT